MANSGTIALQSTGYATSLVINELKVQLTGTGTITMSDNGSNRISATSGSDVLLNSSETIIGAGQIGTGTLTLTNGAGGKIIAQGGNALIVDTTAAANAGLMEALGSGGGLILQSVVNNGSTGVITGNGGNVILQGGTIQGGTLTTTNGGVIIENGSGTLDGSVNAVVNKGIVALPNNTSMRLLGTISNAGTIEIQSSGYGTSLVVASSSVTLSGGGSVTMSDNGGNRIVGASGTETLINVNNTITGAGQLGAGGLTVVNQAAGVIDGSGTNNALVINTGSLALTNAGLIEATGAGGLLIQTAINNGTAGTISDAGATVYLQGGTIQGGTLISSNGGELYENGGGTLDGSTNTVNNAGTVALQNNTTLNLLGTINNTGTIAPQSSGYATNLIIGPGGSTPGTVTLTGNGSRRDDRQRHQPHLRPDRRRHAGQPQQHDHRCRRDRRRPAEPRERRHNRCERCQQWHPHRCGQRRRQ